MRDFRLQQLTQDHSFVAELVRDQQILPEEIYTHPKRNMIYKYLGQKELGNLDLTRVVLRSGDYLLLCSDGLWEMVRSDEKIIDALVSSQSPSEACQTLVNMANLAGGQDNIGVVVVKVT